MTFDKEIMDFTWIFFSNNSMNYDPLHFVRFRLYLPVDTFYDATCPVENPKWKNLPFFAPFSRFFWSSFLDFSSFLLFSARHRIRFFTRWRLEAREVWRHQHEHDDERCAFASTPFWNVTPKMTPIGLLTPIWGLNHFVHFLYLCF